MSDKPAPLAAAEDMSKYYSVQHADEFELDFASDLYSAGSRMTAEIKTFLII